MDFRARNYNIRNGAMVTVIWILELETIISEGVVLLQVLSYILLVVVAEVVLELKAEQ